MKVLTLKDITKQYGDKIILHNFNLEVEQGEFVCIMGSSGSGKSTLLNIMGLLEKPTLGDINILGVNNPILNSRATTKLLRNNISYLFQNYGLVDYESVIYNLKLATHFLKLNRQEEEKRIREALQVVGLEGFEKEKVFCLSGGEQQRVALAKIILKPSQIILADEPTGSLDSQNRDAVLNLLKKINDEGKTVIVVSHDNMMENYAMRKISLDSKNNEKI